MGAYYYEVTSSTPWNYGLSSNTIAPERIKESFVVEKSDEIADYPWNTENAPIKIRVKALTMNNWKEVNGSAGPIAFYTQQGRDYADEEEIVLIPYGCTTLRIAEFPVR